jgi:predicted PurR-regulated permease PerM
MLKNIYSSIGIIVFLLLLWCLKSVFIPFVFALILAYILHPFCKFLIKKKIPGFISVLGVEIFSLVAISSVALLIIPILTEEIPLIKNKLPELIQQVNNFSLPWFRKWGIKISLDALSIKDFFVKHLNANWDDFFLGTLTSLKMGGGFLLTFIGNLVLVPVILFYLLIDWERITWQIKKLIPKKYRLKTYIFIKDCDHVLGQYLRGQLMVMFILAIFYTLGLLIAGFDLALPVGVFTGLAIFVPYLGYCLGLILALIAAALQFGDSYGFLAVALIYGVGQAIESIVLTPYLLGEKIGLHPLVVIFALLAFSHFFGFLGVVIALPISAICAIAVKRIRESYLASELYER